MLTTQERFHRLVKRAATWRLESALDFAKDEDEAEMIHCQPNAVGLMICDERFEPWLFLSAGEICEIITEELRRRNEIVKQ